ncbi:MAG: CTP synthase, partial [Phormidesmis sp.]
VPLYMEKEGLAEQTLTLLNLDQRSPDLANWTRLIERMHSPAKNIEVALVGKYIQLNDAYLSVTEALHHAGTSFDTDVKIRWVDSENIERDGPDKHLEGVSAIVVPGGFGSRGVNGKIQTIQYARERGVPFLGLCLGMQCLVMEWASHIAKLPQANSSEFDTEAENPVISLMPEQEDVVDLGGTMRLGLWPCRIEPDTLASQLYQKEVIYERHRHRYEFNNAYRNLFLETGFMVSGTSPDGRLVEIVELPSHPFFIACQFHPEFQSRPNTPHPMFLGLIEAALKSEEPMAELPVRQETPVEA